MADPVNEKPAHRVRYELQEIGTPNLAGVLQKFAARQVTV